MMQARLFLNSSLVFVSTILCFSCVTPRDKQVASIHVGMLKDQVIDAAGSPTTFNRYQGKDRWVYRVVKDSDITTTEILFQNGKTVYVGPPLTPALSAEEQDKYNQIYNQRQDATEERVREEQRKYNAAHPEMKSKDKEEEL